MTASKIRPWHLYLIRCANGNLYTGITTDVKRRFQEHSISKKGAKSLRGKGPLELVLKRKIGPPGLALKVEHRIKRLSRPEKLRLLENRAFLNTLVRRCGP